MTKRTQSLLSIMFMVGVFATDETLRWSCIWTSLIGMFLAQWWEV